MPDRGDLSATARVFFALWPEESCRVACVRMATRLHAELGGRKARADTLHLTLVFIGAIRRDHLPTLVAAARAVQAESFGIEFDRADCWRHNRVGHLVPSIVPEALPRLVAELEQALVNAGVEFDRRPYKPHLTVVRKGDCRGLKTTVLPEPIAWRASEFVLVESSLSDAGARYTLLERFPLAG